MLFTIVALSFFAQTATAKTVRSLSNLSWTVSNADLGISVPASFPSHVHSALQEAGIIGDPYHGLNEFDQRWIAQYNWTYSAALTGLHREASPSTWLLFEGLDTFSSITLCNHHVAATNNQFRQYHFDVTKIVRGCASDTPALEINFGSAQKIVDETANQPGQETWPPEVEQVFEFSNRQFMRKEQSDFGWDWGPAFSPAGPWLPGYTVQFDGEFEMHAINTNLDVYRLGQRNNIIPDQTQPWVINFTVDYVGTLPSNIPVVTVLENGEGYSNRNEHKIRTLGGRTFTGLIELPDLKGFSWWPHGFGPRLMYSLYISLCDRDGYEYYGWTTQSLSFRTIVLNQEPISPEEQSTGIAPGNHWHFEINGYPFFAKGSNFIPPDVFWSRVTCERARRLLEAVIAANQNMLRIWSSGAYIPDFFYDIADELGILLWSEFEFGDSLYPVDHNFLDNVHKEAVYQVKRLNHHPSLAFWAGGNELENLELAILNCTGSKYDYVRYKDEYEQLFLTTLFPAVFENSRSISYAPSSTSNGYISINFTDPPYMQERYQNLEQGSIYGETDYYNYDASAAFNYSTYPIGRFSNEFGFHSMPSLQSWEQAVDPEDLHFNSTVIQLRNRHYPPGSDATDNFHNTALGMGEMTKAAQAWLPWPEKRDPLRNFTAQCHTTQLFQAAYYTSQIAHYRRGSGLRQRTLGALYWQLNDIWQAPTWAGIEYDGRWKVMHYAAGNAFKNVIVHAFFDAETDEIEVWVMSDLWERTNGVVRIDWFDWSGKQLRSVARRVSVDSLGATMACKGGAMERLALRPVGGGRYRRSEVVMRFSVSTEGYCPNNGILQSFEHEAWLAPTPLSKSKFIDPGLKLSYQDSGKSDSWLQTKVLKNFDQIRLSGDPTYEGSFLVEATTGIAAWVWLDYPSGAIVEFDNNGFWLARGRTREVGYKVVSDTTGGKWKENVTVQSLWNDTLL